MGLTATFTSPYFTGGSINDLVPAIWPVALNGRPYMLDTLPEASDLRWGHETIPLLRQQQDTSESPAEQTLNPNGFWRRAQDSWHHGAGQAYLDRDKEGDGYRFRTSRGVDVWTRYELSLLPDTDQKLVSTNTNVVIVTAGAYLYYADGSTIKRTTDPTVDSPTWQAITYAGGTVTGLCSDGYNVYATDGANIYVGNTGATTLTSTDTTDATIIAYVKARFMAAKTNTLYNIPTLGSATNVMTFAHPNTGFTWTCFGEGTASIFAGGYAGDKSLIYRIAVKADGTALDAPVVAGELPDGELLYSMAGYLGFVFLGTSVGVRMCQVDAQSNLNIGAVIETGAPVRCFEPQDHFVWFGWSGFDGDTGLGRLDITTFTDPAGTVPAYASDLMVDGTTAAVLSIATFGTRRYLSVSGSGIWGETATYVASGTLSTGLIGFGLPDPKIATLLSITANPLDDGDSFAAAITDANGTVTNLGTFAQDGATSFDYPAGNALSARFEVTLTLSRGTTFSPTVLRWTLKAVPTTADGPSELFQIPLLLYPDITIRGRVWPVDVEFERTVISDLRASRQIITYQEFNSTYTGFVSDFKWLPYGLDEEEGSKAWRAKGTLLVDFQRTS